MDDVDLNEALYRMSLYRARWLAAHNILHELTHINGIPTEKWDEYLGKLHGAEEECKQPA